MRSVVGRWPLARLAALASSRSLAALSALTATSRVRSLSLANNRRQPSENDRPPLFALEVGSAWAGGGGSDSIPRWMSASSAFHLDQDKGITKEVAEPNGHPDGPCETLRAWSP